MSIQGRATEQDSFETPADWQAAQWGWGQDPIGPAVEVDLNGNPRDPESTRRSAPWKTTARNPERPA